MSNLHRVCCGALTDPPRLVRAGWYHFLVMSQCGNLTVYIGVPQQTTVGETCEYETIPSEPPVGHPLKVPAATAAKPAIDIECGAYHNVVRHKDHTISCWGLNTMGQCNVPTTSSKGDLTDPANVNLKKIVGLHAGYSTTAVTFADGTVVCWGDKAVSEIVNGWTDILMSPPPPKIDPHTYNAPNLTEINAVDPVNSAYYAPVFDGAYNTDPDAVTYNVHIDRLGTWHPTSKPAQPMFDLGVETDPHLPLELNAEVMTALPSINVQFPRRDPYNPTPGTDPFEVPCTCDNEGDPWSVDYIEKCWRDYVFSRQLGDGLKSCCDLEIKQDFAVAVRRTGQVITTRATNRDASCPAGQTNGASNCRDCTADSMLAVSNGVTSHDLGGGTSLVCTCAADRKFYYIKDGAPLELCYASGGFGGLASFVFEGIGCVGANPATEASGHDPNWARANGGLADRWTSAGQVNAGTPAWQELNYGWNNSAQRVLDGLEPPDNAPYPDCVTVHPATASCNEICPSSASYAVGEQNDYGIETKYYYPVQFMLNGVHAGTNTTHWNSAPSTLEQNGVAFGQCDTQPSRDGQKCEQCGDQLRKCGSLRQYTYPNGGVFSYGCIYALGLDKYGYDNSYRAQTSEFYTSLQLNLCSAVEPANWSWGRMGSKPWGPWHIGVRNGVGDAWNRKGPVCHCCTCEPGGVSGQVAPSPGYPIVIVPAFDMSGLTNSIGQGISQYDQIDKILGTLLGMPWEHNWQHTIPDGLNESGAICPGDCFHQWQGACCLQPLQPCSSSYLSPNPYTQNGCGTGQFEQQYSYFGSSFGLYHPPTCVASARMAFAVIRPDHRTLDAFGDRVEKTNNDTYLPGPVGQTPPRDQTQYNPCDYTVTGCAGTENEFGECATPCEDPQEPMQQACAQVRTEQVLHLWGSLWDPCPPWGRYCLADCELISENPETTKPCCDPDQTNPAAADYCCCDPTETDPASAKYCSPGEAAACGCLVDYCCDPDTDPNCPCDPRLNGPCDCPAYPTWTRVPTHVRLNGSTTTTTNTTRTSAAGSWSYVGGQWVWIVADTKACQYQLPYLPHELCIDCSEHTLQFQTGSDYSYTNP